MKEDSNDKLLVKVGKNGIFHQIKLFLKNLFNKKPMPRDINVTNIEESNVIEKNDSEKNSFIESIKNIENEETHLLKLQKQYRSKEVKEENMTKEQINSLCALYDRQIENLRKSIEIKKKKLLEYTIKPQDNN